MSSVTFCPVPRDGKPDDTCLNPYCGWKLENHYSFGKERTPEDDKIYLNQTRLWEVMRKLLWKENQRIYKEVKKQLFNGPMGALWKAISAERSTER